VNQDNPQNISKPAMRECLENQRRSFLAECALYFQSPVNVAKLAGLRPPFTKQMLSHLESSLQ
jgi:hypothetical protein